MPSIFDAKVTRLEPIRHVNQDIPVIKVIHLRESLFVVAYVSGLIEVLDFDQPEAEPVYRFQVHNQDVDPEDPNINFVPYYEDPVQNGQ